MLQPALWANKQTEFANLIDLFVLQIKHLCLWMLGCNADVLWEIERVSRSLFRFKSPLSREILLFLTRHGGACELRDLFKGLHATTIAARQHIQALQLDGYVELTIHPLSKRCKNICLTAKSQKLLEQYERECHRVLSAWRPPKTSD